MTWKRRRRIGTDAWRYTTRKKVRCASLGVGSGESLPNVGRERMCRELWMNWGYPFMLGLALRLGLPRRAMIAGRVDAPRGSEGAGQDHLRFCPRKSGRPAWSQRRGPALTGLGGFLSVPSSLCAGLISVLSQYA